MKTLPSLPLPLAIGLCAALLGLTVPALAAEDDYRIETVVDGIAVPWGMVWLPNGDMLVSDRRGEIIRVRDGETIGTLAGVPEVHVRGQGGLLDLELHPQFEETGWLYLSYASREGNGRGSHTAIMRARLDGDQLVDKQVLFKGEPNTNSGRHFGSRIEFDNQGYLFFSIGDRGEREQTPQSLSRYGGKVYRLHDDGRVPDDNPFLEVENAIPAIYSWGHRNPQGMAMHPDYGDIWIHEHGPRGGDEINILQPGGNYGWPIVSYGTNYDGTEFARDVDAEGYIAPIWYWIPSIAPSGMAFVTSDKYPEWENTLLVGSLKFNYVMVCHLEDDDVNREEIMFRGIGRVRNVRQGPDGYIYVATEGQGIKRIVPKE